MAKKGVCPDVVKRAGSLTVKVRVWVPWCLMSQAATVRLPELRHAAERAGWTHLPLPYQLPLQLRTPCSAWFLSFFASSEVPGALRTPEYSNLDANPSCGLQA